MMRYESSVMNRAKRAVNCSPFNMSLFQTMQLQGVDLKAIAGDYGVERGFTDVQLNEVRAESCLMWLIRTGVLRREVDGQGLTDSFRLTPLGRQLVDQGQKKDGLWRSPSWFDYVQDALSRWLRLPDWIV